MVMVIIKAIITNLDIEKEGVSQHELLIASPCVRRFRHMCELPWLHPFPLPHSVKPSHLYKRRLRRELNINLVQSMQSPRRLIHTGILLPLGRA